MSERFENAINALVKAYKNNTLFKGSCAACAVGNIVAHNEGYGLSVDKTKWIKPLEGGFRHIILPIWGRLFMTGPNGIQSNVGVNLLRNKFIINKEKLENSAKELECTGYSIEELMKVEYAFEQNTSIHYEYIEDFNKEEIDNDMFKGLMAVVDVLVSFEEKEIDVKSVKERFYVQ